MSMLFLAFYLHIINDAFCIENPIKSLLFASRATRFYIKAAGSRESFFGDALLFMKSGCRSHIQQQSQSVDIAQRRKKIIKHTTDRQHHTQYIKERDSKRESSAQIHVHADHTSGTDSASLCDLHTPVSLHVSFRHLTAASSSNIKAKLQAVTGTSNN